ncbi:hypothetical protein [Streptomyces sp. NPDC002057]|uniref:hypothetical protein n=1 Tax=Streptomyces sp. NPDC002057 TaxID=3154664 RepID=UPI00331B96A1
MPSKSRARSTDGAKLRLTSPLRDKLKAVVFDANAYGFARPDFDQLERLAQRLAGIGVETWVPETVAWEWAEHLVIDWQVLKNAASTERRRLQEAGLNVPPTGYTDRNEVIEAALANLAKIPNVKIIELTGRGAIEGLKDQVLLRPPAKLKGGKGSTPDAGRGDNDSRGVKTGASDSAWIRDVLDLADSDEILIVSADRDVLAAFRAWNKPVPKTRSLVDLKPTLFDFTVDDGHARSAIIRYLREQLPTQLDSDVIDIGRIEGLERAYMHTRDGDGTSVSSYGASVTHLLALAGIDDVMIERIEPTALVSTGRGNPQVDPGTARQETVYATVEFLAAGETTVQSLLHGGDPEVEVISIPNVLVSSHLTFQFSDGVITSMAADSEAIAAILEDAYDDPAEVEAALVDALNMVPGIALDHGPLLDQEISIPGTDAHVGLVTTRRDVDGRWEGKIILWVGGDEAQEQAESVGAEYSYEPSSRWNGADDFRVPGSYPVSVWGNGVYDDHGLWSLPAWLIERIEWPLFSAVATQSTEATDGEFADD